MASLDPKLIQLLAKKIVQGGFRAHRLTRVLGDVCIRLRLEVVAEIRLVFLPNFLGSRFLAMRRVTNIVFNAHFANVKLCIARFTCIESTERKAQSDQ